MRSILALLLIIILIIWIGYHLIHGLLTGKMVHTRFRNVCFFKKEPVKFLFLSLLFSLFICFLTYGAIDIIAGSRKRNQKWQITSSLTTTRKNSMLKKIFNEYCIDIFDDKNFGLNPTDNNNTYQKMYLCHDDTYKPASLYGIQIHENDKIVKTAAISASGGATIPQDNSVLIDKEQLFICCGDSVFSFSLPELSLTWHRKCDTITCFALYKFQGDYLFHGECEISRINNEGKILWQFSGKDIFVSLNGSDQLSIKDNTAFISDFAETPYRIDLSNGKGVIND